MVKNFKTICIWSARVLMFLCSCGENVAKKTISFPLHLSAPTGSLRILLFQPRHYHPSTTSPRHTNVFCRLSWKNFACFLVQSRPNTIANQQRIVIWHYEGRWNATCHELSCLEAGHRPLWRFVRANQKTTASLFSWIVGQVLGLIKRIRTCFLWKVTHKWWNLPIVTKFVR